MAQEPVNYEAVLADLRAKRASLDDAITAIEKVQRLGATTSGDGITAAKTIDPSSIPDDAFFGLSIVEAAKKYLGLVKKKQTIKEIADALDRGGLPHTSSDFVATVATMLRRANDPELAKVGRGDWGLATWYGNRRPKQEPVAKKARPAAVPSVLRAPLAELAYARGLHPRGLTGDSDRPGSTPGWGIPESR